MDPDAEFDAAFGRQSGVALDHVVLHLDRATHRVDHAAKLDRAAVPGAFDGAPAMRGDRGINQIAAQGSEPRQRSLLVGAREPAIADDIGDQDRSDLPRFRHGAASGLGDAIMNVASALSHGASGRRHQQQINSLFHKNDLRFINTSQQSGERSCRKMSLSN
jgi:hypothetical protein